MLENKLVKVFLVVSMPVLRTVAPTVGKTLGLSALAGLAREGASQLVK